MPFVRRNSEGSIVAVYRSADEGASEEVAPGDPELLALLGRNPGEHFHTLDVSFIRVLEDLIDALIAKGVLRVTDLPHEAQRKLSERKGLRRRMQGALDLLGDEGVL